MTYAYVRLLSARAGTWSRRGCVDQTWPDQRKCASSGPVWRTKTYATVNSCSIPIMLEIAKLILQQKKNEVEDCLKVLGENKDALLQAIRIYSTVQRKGKLNPWTTHGLRYQKSADISIFFSPVTVN